MLLRTDLPNHDPSRNFWTSAIFGVGFYSSAAAAAATGARTFHMIVNVAKVQKFLEGFGQICPQEHQMTESSSSGSPESSTLAPYGLPLQV